MRILIHTSFAALAALTAAPALAADMPCPPRGDPGTRGAVRGDYYAQVGARGDRYQQVDPGGDLSLLGDPCDPPIPQIEYGDPGSFYLRGSAALNLMWGREVHHDPAWAALGGTEFVTIDRLGYGYSWGAGFGYEMGNGLRFDVTIDELVNNGLHLTKDFNNAVDVDGNYTLMLRSTIAMANVYYDYYFDSLGLGLFDSGGGGLFGYVGAGVGAAWNRLDANVQPEDPLVAFSIPSGGNISPAAAVMAGVGIDMGTWTADVGYRGIWIQDLNNSPTSIPGQFYSIDNSLTHELRGTIRYRLN